MRANLIVALLGVLWMAGCGGGGGSPVNAGNGSGGGGASGSNVQAVVVDSGPAVVANSSSPAVNTLYTTVTVCSPGSSADCQTIDHVQVDTGSSGLRILASVLTISLPLQKNAAGNVVAECVKFVDGSSWGPLKLADIKIAGESAGNQAIQVIGDAAYSIPAACSGAGTTEDTVTAFGANGILGVGPFLQDCGSACVSAGGGVYYTCTASATCADSGLPLALQVSNPVASFAADNNGIIIQLPALSGTARSVSGSLIFGIGTRANNGLGNAAVFRLNNSGGLSTTYKSTTLDQSFIDSGSNAYYFPDSTIKPCPANTAAPGFFCPDSTLNLSAAMLGTNGTSATINFSVANANSLFGAGTPVAAAATLAGSSLGVSTDNGSSFDGSRSFDWGLPFHFGRSVYTAIENQNTSDGGLGPYFAF